MQKSKQMWILIYNFRTNQYVNIENMEIHGFGQTIFKIRFAEKDEKRG